MVYSVDTLDSLVRVFRDFRDRSTPWIPWQRVKVEENQFHNPFHSGRKEDRQFYLNFFLSGSPFKMLP